MNSTTVFDALHQNITFYDVDGITPITISIANIDEWRKFLLTNAIVCSAQFGAVVVMTICLLVLTPMEKRSKPMFILNMTALIISAISNLLLVVYYPSEWTEFFVWFSGDTSLVSRSTFATDIAANTFGPIYLTAIELPLLYQLKALCGTIADRYRWVIIGIGFLLATVAIGFNFGQMVMNILATYNLAYYGNPAWGWMGKAVDISYTLSIWYFCIALCTKLAMCMWTRHQQGLAKLGAMQVLCIGLGCTMIIPSIFSILEFWSAKLAWEPGPIGHTLVALLLPLSSLWAGTPTEGKLESDATSRRRDFFGSLPSESGSDRFALSRRNIAEATNENRNVISPPPYKIPRSSDAAHFGLEPTSIFTSHVSTDLEAPTNLDETDCINVERRCSVHSARDLSGFSQD